MSTPRNDRYGVGRDALIGAVIGQVRALSTALDQLDQVAAQHFGLNRTDQRSLDVVSQAGAISPTELARAVGVSPSAVTTVIDRLESAGYVQRGAAPDDRRRTVVRATPRTDEVSAELFGGLVDSASVHAQRYSDGELIAIADFLTHHRATINTLLSRYPKQTTTARTTQTGA